MYIDFNNNWFFNLHDRKFHDSPIRVYIGSKKKDGANGMSTGIKRDTTSKASIGEHIERVASFRNHYNEKTLSAFHLTNGSVIDIPVADVLLNPYLKAFKKVENINGIFSDSCGQASHIYSEDAIYKGLMEFIERQSFIHTWLTEYPHPKLDYNTLDCSNVLKEKIKDEKEIMDFFAIYNISYWENVYVIFTIGFNQNSVGVGCAAHFDFENALDHSFHEYVSFHKKNYTEGDSDSENVYLQKYMNLSTEEIIDGYHFLIHSEKEFKLKEPSPKIDLQSILSEHEIDVYCCFLPLLNYPNNIKAVKIFSPQAYPHMNTEILEPDNYLISSLFPIHKGFINYKKALPFP